jgi:hypothetical protein
MGFLLVLIASLLLYILTIPALLFTLIFPGTNKDKYFLNLALSIDQLGNALCRELFNKTLIKSNSSHIFGNPDETISSVLGKNKRDSTLTFTGKILASILDKIDENHCVNSIDE